MIQGLMSPKGSMGSGGSPKTVQMPPKKRGIGIARAAECGRQRLAGSLGQAPLAPDSRVGDAIAVDAVKRKARIQHVYARGVGFLPGQAVFGFPRPSAYRAFEADTAEQLVGLGLEGVGRLVDGQSPERSTNLPNVIEGAPSVQITADSGQAVFRARVLAGRFASWHARPRYLREVLIDADVDHVVGLFRRQADAHFGFIAPILFAERVDAIQVVGVAEPHGQVQVVETGGDGLLGRGPRAAYSALVSRAPVQTPKNSRCRHAGIVVEPLV